MSNGAIVTYCLAVAAIVLLLACAYEPEKQIEDTPTYTVFIEADGQTTIEVKDIGYVQQETDGTLIIQGDGKPVKLR